MNASLHKRPPQVGNLLALCDGVGRYKSGTDERICLHHLQRLFVPAGNIVHIAYVFPFCTKNGDEIIFLPGRHYSCSKERRISHNIIQFFSRHNLVPVHPQCIPLVDIVVSLERKRVETVADYCICFLHHLTLCNPKRSLGHGTSEIVDFNPVELIDGHLDRICHFSNQTVASVDNPQSLILQPAKTGVGFRKEIAAAASRVEELQP